jgi:hypothetical protein
LFVVCLCLRPRCSLLMPLWSCCLTNVLLVVSCACSSVIKYVLHLLLFLVFFMRRLLALLAALWVA